MKTYKRNFIRPHTDAPWYTPSDEFTAWIKETYIDTGKCTKWREMTYDDDTKLTMTLESNLTDDMNMSIVSESIWQVSQEEEVQHNTDWGIIVLSHGEV